MQRYYFELACLFALLVSVHFLSKLCSSTSLLPPHHTSASGSLPVSGITVSSIQLLSHVQLFVTPLIVARQASLSITKSWSPPKPMSIEWWNYPTISPSVVPFSSCLQYFPASGSFPMSQLFAWGVQSIGIAASASVLPMNTQDWSPLGWTGWIFLQSKGLSRVFSNTTVQKHQFFGVKLSSLSNSHIHTYKKFFTIQIIMMVWSLT